MMNKPPSVSIIIPTHNRSRMLKRAVDSVLAQSYQDFEVIVVSDGSTDNTDEVMSLYSDPRITFLKHDRAMGASAARNTGMKASKGAYIAFLDDDDVWVPHKLEVQLPVIENSPDEVGLVYAWMEYVKNGKVIDVRDPTLKGYVFPEMLDKQAIGGCPTVIIKREVIVNVGYFDETLLRGNDGDYWRRITKNYHVDFIPAILAKIYVEHDDRITSESVRGLYNNIYAYETWLKKFHSDYLLYPEAAGNVLFIIASSHFKLANYGKGCKKLLRACSLNKKRSLFFIYRTIVLIIKSILIKPDKNS